MAMSVQGIPETILLPGHDPVRSAAASLLAHADAEARPLAQYIVLLPHLSLVPDLSAALAAAAGGPLLLPRFHTLQSLAGCAALPQPLRTDSQRESLLYQALQQRGWFEPAQLWRICDELLALFDELTRQGLTLPASLLEFERQLADAYAARASAPLHFEAALVHELWFAMVASDGHLDACSRYHLQLAQLAQNAQRPLAAIGLPPLSPAEMAFLQAWARREPVCILQPRLAATEAASQALQAALLPAVAGAAQNLGERAGVLRAQLPDSPLAQRLEMLPAPSLEAHAGGIVACIQAWLAAGKGRIGVVVLDRLVARRARALLERSQILVQDESGWAFSTTSASAAMMRWLEAATGGLAVRPLLDVLKSPFVLPDWPGSTRRAAVGRLEQRLRAGSHPAGWLAQFLQDEADAGCRELLQRLQQARVELPDTPRPLAAWLRQLLASLAMLGIVDGFQADAAGRQLLGLLDGLAQELAQDTSDYDSPAFQRWLQRRLERECFIDETLASPVVFLPFSQARMRQFDVLLLAGADAGHLPAADAAQAFFNQAVRAQLGLPTREQARAREREELALLLAAAPHAVISWQAQKDGEYNLASPWIEQLLAFHEAAWGRRLPAVPLPPSALGRDIGAIAALRPQPVLPPTRVPRTLSVAACQSLAACPYQFFARYGLGLARLGELDGQMDKRDYGAFVHQVLAQFHKHYPALAGEAPSRLETAFADLVEAAFARCAAEDYMSQGWKQRLLATLPGYLAWQRDWEAAGWQIAALDVQRQAVLDLGGGRQLQLSGRIDRIDRQADGRLAVIDYTTQGAATLRRQIGQGKEAQLALSALLVDGPVQVALFLGLDRERVEAVTLDGDGDLQAQIVAARTALAAQVQGLYDGAPLPATPGAACQYCEMGGLCRKEDWPPALDETGGAL